ncbi:methionyl-tRNA formyltransferase [Thiomicrospira sp. WB1]|uniref:methionyl-tRNA formyltransferase n=1 Tax=Thiomicrospira sp. WB1 TaxID=1685380 RepID=UPI00074AD014|nr:methionyl-tRNA formyltransferase [Thiomicrospira sp. WB1]KUJ71199.1 methionyl-tRNA formyltransferase [Thiomicrospira sp. WB1]
MTQNTSQTLNIVFAGTPDFAVPALSALIDSPHTVCGVYTQPDRPAGRGRKLTPSPVKAKALEHDLPVFQPQNFKDPDDRATLQALRPDLMVVVAYGLILPQSVLDIPTYGCLNIHGSLLPRWRGAAPIQRAIEAGDPQTGVTIMQMAAGLDTGPMLTTLATEIDATDTAQSLHDRLADLGAQALMTTLDQLTDTGVTPIAQDDAQATYAQKLSKAEAAIDWHQPAQPITRKIQAFNPWPVATTQWQTQTLRLWEAQCRPELSSSAAPGTVLSVQPEGVDVATGEGMVRLITVQPPGKKAMAAYDFAQSRQLTGQVLT